MPVRPHPNLAIELVLILRLVFRLGLRQAEGFASSVLRLLGLDLPVPDHTNPEPAWSHLCQSPAACRPTRPLAPAARQHRPEAVREGRVELREARPGAPVLAQV